MEDTLFRVMARAADQRVALKLRAGAAVQPAELSDELIAEFGRILQIDRVRESLLARLEAHIVRALRKQRL